MPAPGSPSPHPARGAEPSPSRNKSPFSPACPAETLFRSHPPGSQRALTARRGEPGGLGRADRAARAGSRRPPSPAPALQPPRGHPGCPHPAHPHPTAGTQPAGGHACRRAEGERGPLIAGSAWFFWFYCCTIRASTQAKARTEPAQGEGDFREHRERQAQTHRCYTYMHTSFSVFLLFFFC